MSCCLSLVVLFLFRFRFFAFNQATALRPIVLRYVCMRPDSHTTDSYLTTKTGCVLLCLCFFLFCFCGDYVVFRGIFRIISLPFPL